MGITCKRSVTRRARWGSSGRIFQRFRERKEGGDNDPLNQQKGVPRNHRRGQRPFVQRSTRRTGFRGGRGRMAYAASHEDLQGVRGSDRRYLSFQADGGDCEVRGVFWEPRKAAG